MTTLLFIVIVVLQLLDGVTTHYSLTKLNSKEINPVARYLMDKIGIVPSLALLKAAVVSIFVVYSYPLWFYAAVAALYTGVVGNNAYVIYKSKAGSN